MQYHDAKSVARFALALGALARCTDAVPACARFRDPHPPHRHERACRAVGRYVLGGVSNSDCRFDATILVGFNRVS
jgi:hypothetical protein